MALASTLKVYEDTYQFVKEITWVYKQMNKIYRPSLGSYMMTSSLDMLKSIENANRAVVDKWRVHHQEATLANLSSLKTLLRLCSELHLISIKKHAHIARIMDGIGKQLNGWKKASENTGKENKIVN